MRHWTAPNGARRAPADSRGDGAPEPPMAGPKQAASRPTSPTAPFRIANIRSTCSAIATISPTRGLPAIASALHLAFTPARSWGGISMRLTYRRPLALCAVAALALAAPAVAAAHGSGHGHDDHHGKGLRAIKRVVVIYEENHSFDNLYGGWEGVNGLRRADAAHTHAGQPGRHAVHVPAAERRQPDVAAAQRRRARTRRRRPRSTATSRTPRSRSTTFIPPTARRARRPACSPPTACRRARPARRLHARPRAPLLPGAVPAQRRQAEPLHDRQRRRRPDPGRLRHARAADLQVPARQGPSATTRSPTASSRRRSAARSSTTSG